MSTFRGTVKEFPQIRIDYFKVVSDHPPPLAAFLSHVHSDHLLGLENFKSPFVYCSPATREILLRLEKYPHRMNFARGILEVRKRTYRHLSKLLKTIPLETPTRIELGPRSAIQVTLFDANHCVGACMFLIQDSAGKAILYTGDIRSEPWFVNALIRNPILVQYTLGPKRLDCIYLDTTFATKSDIYREFPSKAEGIQELLQKVERCPADTMFYFNTWTFGYEQVWIALSAALASQVHLDPYKWNLYRSLTQVSNVSMPAPPEGAALCGYTLGNHCIPGCLTKEVSARIHSCERGAECDTIKNASNAVRIIPIVTRTRRGADVVEPGAGGGLGDLSEAHELDLTDPNAVSQLMALCALHVKDGNRVRDIHRILTTEVDTTTGCFRLEGLDVAKIGGESDVPLHRLAALLQSISRDKPESHKSQRNVEQSQLPTITFPYSRHSSYNELCELVAAFRPLDVYPCTVDEATWSEHVSMRALFGEFCSANLFAHDRLMREKLELPHFGAHSQNHQMIGDLAEERDNRLEKIEKAAEDTANGATDLSQSGHCCNRSIQRWAYDAAAGLNDMTWEIFGGLDCTKANEPEFELGDDRL